MSDRVFSFNDGENEQFLPETVAQIISKHANASAADILAALRTATETFLGDAPRAFGCSILVIKRT